MEPLAVTHRPLNSLIPYARNARKHTKDQVRQIADSIREFGWTVPVLIDAKSGIIAGHGRLLAAELLGIESVPVIEITHLTPQQKRAYILADNKLAHNAGWDTALLAAELGDLKAQQYDLALTGFDAGELESLLGPDVTDGLTDPDDVPELLDEATTQTGDIWTLGSHRLVCGDCTNPDTVSALFDGHHADSLITDPPYGVDYAEKTRALKQHGVKQPKHRDIANDNIKNYRAFFRDFLRLAPLREPNTIYVFMSGKELHSLRLAFDDCRMTWAAYLIWLKNQPVLSRGDYNQQHEFCAVARKKAKVTAKADGGIIAYGWKGRHKFYGNFGSTLLEFPKPHKSTLHPTMKPVALISRLMTDGTAPGAVVYDPFLGSGTTLIAAEHLKRICYGSELDPLYCDVAIARWQEFTGKQAKLGEQTYDEVKRERTQANTPGD
jgi:DNA modification methylase